VISANLAVTTLVCFFHFAREAAGASSARHSPRPLIFWGERFMHDSGDQRRGNAESCLECPGCLKSCCARSQFKTHSSCPDLIRASINLRKSFFEKMDHRVEPGDDDSLWVVRWAKRSVPITLQARYRSTIHAGAWIVLR
jgi:hypothetical protein